MSVRVDTTERQEGIVVIGEATGVASPDAVELMVAVRAAAQAITQALREHSARVLSLTQMVNARGVNACDIRTAGVNVMPIFASGPPAGTPSTAGAVGYGDTPPTGYQVDSSMRITVHDVNRVAELLDAIQLGPSLAILGIWYRVGDESTARRVTLDRAIKDARLKAQAIAAGIGKQLGEPISIVENGHANGNGTAVAVPGVPSPFQPGELVTHVAVRVSYSLQ
jgi:uncharacterized protein YggE